ncbi:MAG TPA: VOC family protein [Pyrinomonadaceae bacterium]|jgi:catechol 2,3-dioxygenase-like lactoylglutathione lyase family enzyme|nr:VOC family protein [Pyrinomonadaceae bacterium]
MDSNGKAQTAQTGHVGLNVSDLERSSRFYQDVFGFRVSTESREGDRRFIFLSDGGGKLVLTLWEQSDGRFEKSQPGLHHLSFHVGSIEEVREAEARLRAAGANVYYGGVVSHAEGADSGGIFFEDPDGIRLEIFTPRGAKGLTAPAGESPSCGFF